jgi:hypothetical protein
MKRKTLTGLWGLCALAAGHAQAEWRLDAETGAFFDSNLSNAERESDVRADWAWRSDVRIGDGFQLTRDLRLNAAGDLRGEIWDRFGSFNQIDPGALIGLRYRCGLGRQAPWLLLENRFGYDRFQETERSGWTESVNLRGGIGLTERIALEAGYGFENHVAPDTFYDRQNHQALIRAIVDPVSSLRVAVGYIYREGDVISYATPPRPDLVRLATEVRPGETTFGSGHPLTAYKLLGRTHDVSVSAVYTLTKYVSLEVDYDYAVTLHDPLQYENHFVAAKVLFAY